MSSIDNGTELCRAASRGDVKLVKTLIDRGSDLNARDRDGLTALMHAAMRGHGLVVDALVEGGADLEARDDGGRAAIQLAALACRHDAVGRLIVAGASFEPSEIFIVPYIGRLTTALENANALRQRMEANHEQGGL